LESFSGEEKQEEIARCGGVVVVKNKVDQGGEKLRRENKEKSVGEPKNGGNVERRRKGSIQHFRIFQNKGGVSVKKAKNQLLFQGEFPEKVWGDGF